MTVPSAVTTFRYEGNGVTTLFAYSNRLLTTADVQVQLLTRATDAIEETLALTTDYTVTIVSNSLANITITNPAKVPSITQDILLTLNLAISQTRSFPRADSLPAGDVEKGLDKLTMVSQLLKDSQNRSLRFPPSDTSTDGELPPKADRLGKFLAFGSSDGEPIATEVAVGSTPVSAFGATLVQSADAATARTTLGVDAAPFVDSTAIIKGSADATKLLRIEVDGLTTGTTRVWTAPDSDLTVMGTSTSQLVSNKTFNDASCFFVDDGDATKRAALQCSGITTGTTRTITVPDKSGTLAMTSDIPASYTSSAQTITSAGLLTLAHGLGAAPKEFFPQLTCTTANANWAIGDVINISLGPNYNANGGANVYADTTNIYVRYGSDAQTFAYGNKTTGAGSGLTNSSWTFSIRAKL